MATEEPNPFELQPTQPLKQPPWGGMPTITPQGGAAEEGGSYFALSPEAMQMMWAPQPTMLPAQPTTLMPAQPQPERLEAPPTTIPKAQPYGLP